VSSAREARQGRTIAGTYGLPAALWGAASIAWGAIALGPDDVALPGLCTPTAEWPNPAATLNLVLALNPPAALAAGWALMIAAMMPPLIMGPLRHVRDRSFARRRGRGMVLFVAGYGAAWMAAGVALQSLTLALRLAAPEPLPPLAVAAAVALVWQVSPAKQWCLNACHRRPALAAFGAAADLDVFGFGLMNGASCAGACWALMVLPLLVGRGHVLAMIAVALFVSAERLERPAPLAWRWRGPGKALRVTTAQSRMRLAPRSCERG
jgi:predicted metal-binding membrane protein